MKKAMKIFRKMIAFACVLFLLAGTAAADGIMSLPEGLQIIEEEAFAGTSATIVVIPENASEIGSKAFNPANGLTDVYLPAKKLTIGSRNTDTVKTP